jgi:hypothetical protein
MPARMKVFLCIGFSLFRNNPSGGMPLRPSSDLHLNSDMRLGVPSAPLAVRYASAPAAPYRTEEARQSLCSNDADVALPFRRREHMLLRLVSLRASRASPKRRWYPVQKSARPEATVMRLIRTRPGTLAAAPLLLMSKVGCAADAQGFANGSDPRRGGAVCGQLLSLPWPAHAGIGKCLRFAEISAGATRSIPELGHSYFHRILAS